MAKVMGLGGKSVTRTTLVRLYVFRQVWNADTPSVKEALGYSNLF